MKNLNAGGKSSRMVIGLTVLLLLAVAGFITTLITTGTAGSYDRQYIRHSGELRVLSQEIAKNAAEAAAGRAEAFDGLRKSTAEFTRRWGYLRNGDATENLPPSPEQVSSDIGSVQSVWEKVQNDTTQILASRDSVLTLHELANTLRQAIPQLQREYDEAIAILLERNAAANQLVMAQRQSWLAERMISNVSKILEGNEDAVLAADAFELDAAEFNRVYEGMLSGDAGLNVSRVRDPQVLALFESIAGQFQVVRDSADRIIQASPELFQVRDAANTISADSSDLLNQTSQLTEHYQNLSNERAIAPYHAYILGGVALLIALALGVTIYRGTRKNLNLQSDTNERNQEAIMRLLDEIADLADGDLTTSATVTEDFTGAIADSINFAIEQLRSLVISINENSLLVSRAAEETQSTASQLSEASLNQAKEISEATGSINTIARSMNNVSENADESSKVAEQSVVIANKGSAAVQNTINGMDKIREQIQKTSKQIKRLGESSQEIGDIVSLINDIADQTNILSLNAAIQASMAGEAGRGFAVVADEVQRLAERSSAATKQIEVLVKTIQADTNEAVISMEHTTAEVVQGARLAQDAGVALGEIEKVSNDLARLIREISGSAREQSEAANRISSTMNVIQEITTQTSSGTMATATSIGNLAEMAKEMRDTVSGFKLPSEVAAAAAMNEDFSDEAEEVVTRRSELDKQDDSKHQAHISANDEEGNIDLPEFDQEQLGASQESDEMDLDLEIDIPDDLDSEHDQDHKRNISAA